jgi:hypothetical protein
MPAGIPPPPERCPELQICVGSGLVPHRGGGEGAEHRGAIEHRGATRRARRAHPPPRPNHRATDHWGPPWRAAPPGYRMPARGSAPLAAHHRAAEWMVNSGMPSFEQGREEEPRVGGGGGITGGVRAPVSLCWWDRSRAGAREIAYLAVGSLQPCKSHV